MLAYLLDRALAAGQMPAPGIAPIRAPLPVGLFETRMGISSAPLPEWAAWLILRRLADGVTPEQLASELRLDLQILLAALNDVAKRAHTSAQLASILRKLATGAGIEQAASELGLTNDEVKAELDPTESLSGALCAALMARAALPQPPSVGEGIGPSGPLRTMPVRFPEQQYQRLKDWSERHNFPMAVVVRGLVERFLDEQQQAVG